MTELTPDQAMAEVIRMIREQAAKEGDYLVANASDADIRKQVDILMRELREFEQLEPNDRPN